MSRAFLRELPPQFFIFPLELVKFGGDILSRRLCFPPKHVDPQIIAEALYEIETQEPVNGFSQRLAGVVLRQLGNLLSIKEK